MGMTRRAKKPKAPKGEYERMPLVEKDLRELALKLHTHLERATIYAVGKPRGSKTMCCGGAGTLGKISKTIQALVKDDLGDAHYLAILGLDKWTGLAAEAKKRVLDHLLCHAAGRDGETDEWKLAPHDVQEFTAVIKRHGLDGSPGLRSFVEAAKQLTLVGV